MSCELPSIPHSLRASSRNIQTLLRLAPNPPLYTPPPVFVTWLKKEEGKQTLQGGAACPSPWHPISLKSASPKKGFVTRAPSGKSPDANSWLLPFIFHSVSPLSFDKERELERGFCQEVGFREKEGLVASLGARPLTLTHHDMRGQ